MALSVCHAVWWRLCMHTTHGKHCKQTGCLLAGLRDAWRAFTFDRHWGVRITKFLIRVSPYYHGYTAIFIPIPTVLPWLLSPFPREYRCYCPHYHSNYCRTIPMSLFRPIDFITITLINTFFYSSFFPIMPWSWIKQNNVVHRKHILQ